MRKLITLLSFFLYIALPGPIYAQESMNDAEQKNVIDSLVSSLEANYVFPKVAKKMGKHLHSQFKAGTYKDLTNPVAFGDQLTKDLQSISHDKHLRVRFAPEDAQAMRAYQEEEEEERDGPDEEYLKRLKRDNFGFKEVKILEGNVGYLDLRGFMSPSQAGETATAAMNMLANTEAIIFDLRQNGGGDPAMIQLLTSYLYGANDHVHLNSFYFRPSDDTTQTWTLPYVSGNRNPKAEVLVLTSSYTFSAAEEFTYNLKNLERATIVGETTGGGAHPGGTRPIDQRFVAFVPIGRAINPVTNTNWEGTGVTPHVEVAKEKALSVAHALAMEKLSEKAKTAEDKKYYVWYATYLKAKSNPIVLSEKQMTDCAGQFGPRSLLVENGQLYYQREGRPKMILIPLSTHSFALQEDPNIQFSVEIENGQASALVLKSIDGWQERTERKGIQP